MAAEPDRHFRDLERLHEGMVVELDRRLTDRQTADRGERQGGTAARLRKEPDVDTEVATTINVVRQVASVLADLQETVRRQEELLYDQRQLIADLQHQKQAAYAELTDLERTAKGERERADRAEHRLQSGEMQIRRLEEYSGSLKAHLNSVMHVVRDSLAEGTTSPPRAPAG